MQRRLVDLGFATGIDDDDVGIRADPDRALARIETPQLRRIDRRCPHVLRKREPAAPDLGQHERHRGLDAEHAALAFPDALAVFLLRGVGRMVGGDSIDLAAAQRLPQTRVIGRIAQRRIAAHDTAATHEIVHRQQQVLRAGLDRDIHAARPGRGNEIDRGRGALVRDVDRRPGPLGEYDAAGDRFDRADVRP